jgi:MFS family permease
VIFFQRKEETHPPHHRLSIDGDLFLMGLISPSSAQRGVIFLLVVIFGLTGIGWNAIWLTMVGEAGEKSSSGLATAAGFFIGNLGSLLGPPLFGYIVGLTDSFSMAWQFWLPVPCHYGSTETFRRERARVSRLTESSYRCGRKGPTS